MDSRFNGLIKNTYNKPKFYIKACTIVTENIIRQGDTISHKLFITVLEEVFCKINWTNEGLKIDSEYLSHLRFAGDTPRLSNNDQKLDEMINELKNKLSETRLIMNKLMTNTIRNLPFETVEECIYLDQKIRTKKTIFPMK